MSTPTPLPQPPAQGQGSMTNNDDVKYQLARIEGKLDATLPFHSAKLQEHDNTLKDHDARIRSVENGQAATSAVHTQEKLLPTWVSVTMMVAALAAALIALYSAIKH